jgi:hypothetical protein
MQIKISGVENLQASNAQTIQDLSNFYIETLVSNKLALAKRVEKAVKNLPEIVSGSAGSKRKNANHRIYKYKVLFISIIAYLIK